MANAQLMEEELQQSVVLSEEDAEFEEDDVVPDITMTDNGAPRLLGPNSGLTGPDEDVLEDHEEDGGEEDGEVDIITHQDFHFQATQRDELEIDPADDEDADHEDEDSESESDDVHDDDEAFDVDAEGEDDEEEGVPQPKHHADADGDLSREDDELPEEDIGDDEDEDEAEGVGAVKIKPGETDDEESDSEASDSSASAFSDRESVAEWDEIAENDEEEDEESDAIDPTVCIFCKKDAGRDLVEEPEANLTCKGCGEYAHQQCARDGKAIDDRNGTSHWKCPECLNDDEDSDFDSEAGAINEKVDTEGDVDMNSNPENEGDISPTSGRRASAPQIARDLLPPQRGVNKPDSHSMFNQLVLDEDPMDGSRVLRKRKTSSAEAEDGIMSLRKRQRNTSDESTQDDASQEQANGGEPSTRPRSARSLRLKVSSSATQCSVVKKSRSSFVLKIRVNAPDLRRILLRESKSSKKRPGGRTISQPPRAATARSNTTATTATTAAEPPTTTQFFSSSFSQPFYSFYDKETDELKSKPYGGILTEEQADTTKTLPTKDDRRRFDEAKQKAEAEWRSRLLAMQAETEIPARKSKKATGPASQIECIEFGGWEIDTWYAAPYPEEYSRNRVLYICEFCLKYMNSDYVAWRHKLKCPAKHPPGDEIYRHGSISFFEVDGRKNPVYCQNLCLLAKLFLGSKTLYYDVEPFLFYVLCEYDDLGYHFVGYFSKEKRASSQNNVSCILTLPIHQRKGYGHLLIDFSYLLTRVEEKSGSPEKPLSDMGLVSYRNYWRLILCKYLIEHVPEVKTQKRGLSIRQISDDTGMTPDDAISALEALRFLVRDPVTHVYAFRVDLPYCHKEVAKWEAKNYVKLNPQALTWTPYVMGRGNATNFELGPALNTVAPREDDEETKPVEAIAGSAIVTDVFAVADSPIQKPPADGEPAVLESTEPNDNIATEILANAKINGVDKENNGLDLPEQSHAQPSADGIPDPHDDEDNWQRQYENIPVSRFQVFPPISRRPGMSRAGSSIARPVALPRASSAVRTPAQPRPRPRARRPTGSSSVRRSAQKKSSSAKRKTGGTGRGPGRWPKGTKKSDYGNADSGPGLPPSWIEKGKSKLASRAVSDADEENEMHDTVQVQINEMTIKKGKQVDTISARFEVRDDINSESVVQSSASSTNEFEVNGFNDPVGDEDVVMDQTEEYEDPDAPGEEE
ncbi:hypothetical protein F5Y19DRAFT_478587 [Xylariaceae sp. FL1651]|nr:hypothetical protein F5Y19DRAFT_478587 [Xylariaceae sp. FL1651]